MKIISYSEYQRDFTGKKMSVKLNDFWWIFHKRKDGRTGHSYCAPALMTLSIWIERIKGKDAFWICGMPEWESPLEDYDPATAVINRVTHFSEVHFYFSHKAVKAEMWLNYQLLKIRFWLRGNSMRA